MAYIIQFNEDIQPVEVFTGLKKGTEMLNAAVRLLPLSLSFFLLSSALAADTTEIRIQAILETGSCTPSLDNAGLLDFGGFPVSHLFDDTPSGLDTRSITLHISCTEPVAVAYTFQDDQNDTLDGGSTEITTYGFGIGQTEGGVNIGHFYLYPASAGDPTVNSLPARTIYSENNGNEWHLASSATMASNSEGNLMAFSDTRDFSHPLNVETADTELTIHPVVQSKKTLALSDDQPYEGLATIRLVYL